MRPPEFTGGNRTPAKRAARRPQSASMRPPEFTGGNMGAVWWLAVKAWLQ